MLENEITLTSQLKNKTVNKCNDVDKCHWNIFTVSKFEFNHMVISEMFASTLITCKSIYAATYCGDISDQFQNCLNTGTEKCISGMTPAWDTLQGTGPTLTHLRVQNCLSARTGFRLELVIDSQFGSSAKETQHQKRKIQTAHQKGPKFSYPKPVILLFLSHILSARLVTGHTNSLLATFGLIVGPTRILEKAAGGTPKVGHPNASHPCQHCTHAGTSHSMYPTAWCVTTTRTAQISVTRISVSTLLVLAACSLNATTKRSGGNFKQKQTSKQVNKKQNKTSKRKWGAGMGNGSKEKRWKA